MRIQYHWHPFRMLILLCFLSQIAIAQGTGNIIRSAGLPASQSILDAGTPTGYTSKTTAGFANDDVGNSKLPYKPIPSYSNEPFADLRRGPNNLYSDFVPDANGSGVYVHFDGNNLLFRMRLGSVVPGAKGYSILIDTDGRFGAVGPNADPNFQAATTGVNGNPGFEIEIDLFTQNASNPGIAIYDVDGNSNPVLKKSYPNWIDYSQLSIAGTFDNGDPDFFLDFYVTLADITAAFPLVTASTPLRMSATTVMAPSPAIGGPKSDIYGLNDGLYKDPMLQYETYINALPAVSLSTLNNTTNTYSAATRCTAPPVISTSSLSAGTVSISGTWSKDNLTGTEQTPATIRLYKIAAGTTNVSFIKNADAVVASAGTWTASNITVAAGDIIYATAQATNESECLRSNTVQAASLCTAASIPPMPVVQSCTNSGYTKGFSGTNYQSGWTIVLENISAGTVETSSSTGNLFAITGNNWTYSNGCSGQQNLPGGAYRIYYRNNATNCVSEPFFFCLQGNGQNVISTVPTTTPVITSAITPGTSRIAGTGEAGAKSWLYIDGVLNAQSPVTIASNGTFQFVGLSLVQGQSIFIRSVFASTTLNQNKCGATSELLRVNCYTNPPIISSTTNTGNLKLNEPITGISREAAGTLVRIYEVNTAITPNTYTLAATTPVMGNGTWATTSANGTTVTGTGTTPANFNTAANKTYAATAQMGSCTLSAYTANLRTGTGITSGRCGAITSTVPASNPVVLSSKTTSISGTLSGTALAGTTIRIYEDGALVAQTVTGTNTWGPINVSGMLYPGNGSNTGIVSIGIQEPDKEEQMCTNTYPVTCTPATLASFSFSSCSSGCTESTVKSNSTLTYNVTNATIGDFYTLRDVNTGKTLSGGTKATTTAFSITTFPLANAGAYSIQLVGSNVSATEMCSTPSSARQYTVLPIELLEFRGERKNEENKLTWVTAIEYNASHFEVERSTDGSNFIKIGSVATRGSGSAYNIADRFSGHVSYYRLKMIDLDGKYKYSKVVILQNNSSITTTVHPNPFTKEINVVVNLQQSQNLKIEVLDGSGRQVKLLKITGVKGINSINITGLERLLKGIYILKVDTGDAIFQQKLLKAGN